MPPWIDDRRLKYFVCLFPIAILALIPLSSVILDFLMIFSLAWTLVFFWLNIITETPMPARWLIVFGLSTALLRLIIVGAALRKIAFQGASFDGQILRTMAESIHLLNIETLLILCNLAYLGFRIIILNMGIEISSAADAYIDLATDRNADAADIRTSAQEDAQEQMTRIYGISGFFAKLSTLEIRVLPILLAVTFFSAIQFRDRLLPVSIEMSVQTSAIVVFSLLCYVLPTSLLGLLSHRTWIRSISGKPLARVNARVWLFERRYRLMIAGPLLVAVSFVPDFPRILLVLVGGGLFGAGLLSDILEIQTRECKIEDNLVASATTAAVDHNHQVKLQLGRDIWNDYYVYHEQDLMSALTFVRLITIKDSGIVFGEITVEFNRRLQADCIAIIVNGERVGKTRLPAHPEPTSKLLSSANKNNDPLSTTRIASSTDYMTKLICDKTASVLKYCIPSLSHDPAIDQLIKGLEF